MQEELNQQAEVQDVPDITEGADTAPAEKPTGKDKKDKKGLHSEVAALTAATEKAKKEAADATEKLLRTAAEYENYRKRSTKEKDGAFQDGISHTVNLILPVIDTLALAANAQTQDEEYKKGVIMTLAKCEEAFKALGVSEIEALDKQFDPQLHCAVMQQESDKESGTITAVFQKGYLLGEKVIRHSSVAVAQ
ncbi:MAG: nucleotide exchange factor GrpE [Oscillospiraceae bacterium]